MTPDVPSKLPAFPPLRLRTANHAPWKPDGSWVLYWMTSARRPRWSFALERAADWARELGRPLLVLEGLRAGYPWASDRHHRYVLDGMADNGAAFAAAGVRYLPYVEPRVGDGRGLLAALAAEACVVVGDDHPGFFFPGMLAAAGRQLQVRLELVDGNGLLPVATATAAAPTAYVFRRLLQRELPAHLADLPVEDPLATPPPPWRDEHESTLAAALGDRWRAAGDDLLAGSPAALAALPIDHTVAVTPERGGWRQGELALRRFVEQRLQRYEERNQPEVEATSELSAYLHFGHLSAHQVFLAVAEREGWTPLRLAGGNSGARAGWWQMSAPAEGFLDQLVTWRELGFNACARLPDVDRFHSLPAWARRTLQEHATDPRPDLYTFAQLEEARTGDPVWNAAQRQLRREGRIHNYLRMLWGKKVLEWSPSPAEAWDRLLALNDRWAIDGRDPNSLSGIAWCFGRYDRPWAPVREVFGSIRYMSSASTLRKLRLKGYLQRYGPLAG